MTNVRADLVTRLREPTRHPSAHVGVLCVLSLGRLRRGGTGVFLPAIAAYSPARVVIEAFRDDPDRNFLGPLSTSQWIALALLAAYVVWRVVGLRVRSAPQPSPSFARG